VNSEKVIQAAKLAGVHDMILHFPKGYDTPLGDAGAGLSGGQKQRIGLARAMYGDPSLLVLDEPNSNLDEVGEQALLFAINTLRQMGKTIVLITHRNSVLAATTKLMLIKEGVAQFFGPRDEVIAALTKAAQAAQQQLVQSNPAAQGQSAAQTAQGPQAAQAAKPPASSGETNLQQATSTPPEDAQARIEAANNVDDVA
jgi:ATP-binding cassette subfamily C exporter for protease/lipase